jgi:hypothetical protein
MLPPLCRQLVLVRNLPDIRLFDQLRNQRTIILLPPT